VEAISICESEKRNPRSHGIPECSRQRTTMIREPLRSPNCQANSVMGRQAILGKFRQVVGRWTWGTGESKLN